MADYPCDVHNSRYQGPSNRVYLNIYREEEAVQLKGSVCGDCLASLVSEWMSWALHQAPAGNWDPPLPNQALEDLWKPAGASGRPLNGYRRA